jgi:large subunit ribosomal protein L3
VIKGIIGKKIGMTQTFDEEGRVSPVTVIEAGPCVVVQKKTTDRDGYSAVQLGLVEKRSRRRTTKAIEGHFKKYGVQPLKHMREFQLESGDEDFKPGQEVRVDIFKGVEKVDITGISKGKGFQGVVRRHGFHGGGATHGSMFHRAPGGIGASADPSRVYPGTKMPGQMGGARVTVKNLKVVRVIEDQNLLLVRGAVPGARRGYLLIRESRASKRKAGQNADS